ncbi:hypothetical protein Tco_0534382 [Tanacetum coccineum]
MLLGNSRNKRKQLEKYQLIYSDIGPSMSTGTPLTQEEAEREALAISIYERYSILEEERPIIETMACGWQGAYNLGVATPRALVHAGDKTSGDARSLYMISGDAKSWVVIVLHIFTVILHNCPLFEILAHRLGFLQTNELTNIIVDVFEYHFQVKRMIVKVVMCDS